LGGATDTSAWPADRGISPLVEPLPTSATATTVVIWDEHLLFGEAFAKALQSAGMDAVAVSTPAEATSMAMTTSADLFVISVRPPVAAVLAVIRRIRACRPTSRVVCLWAESAECVRSCREAGGDLVLSRSRPLQELVDALAPSSPADQFPAPKAPGDGGGARSQQGRRQPPLAARFLTRREMDVLRLLVAARPTGDIAKTLGITVPTTRGYIQSTFTKLGVHSRVEAVKYAVVHSLVDVGPR
jgi:DNA-binding NarL/FixJ family response regulator